MADASPTLAFSVDLPGIDPATSFERLVAELARLRLEARLRFDLTPHGAVYATGPEGGERVVGRISTWDPPRSFALTWSPPEWEPNLPPARVEYDFAPAPGGTRLTIRYLDWGRDSKLSDVRERIGWAASEIVAPLMHATSSIGFGDWYADRVARRPTGERARATYADPTFHRPNFLLLLDRLQLTADDRLLEVGCGGGAFLRDALTSGCRAWAIDHSREMLDVAREQNRVAIEEGRLELRESEAYPLPFADALCTAAVSTGVFTFLDDPVTALREIHRVLRPGGRLYLFEGTKELRDTPAAPEPVASRVHFHEDDELASLARAAGFIDVRVDRPDLVPYARRAGLPTEAVEFFASLPRGGQVLEAHKAR
jgi:SAM-dependent methyltransferase